MWYFQKRLQKFPLKWYFVGYSNKLWSIKILDKSRLIWWRNSVLGVTHSIYWHAYLDFKIWVTRSCGYLTACFQICITQKLFYQDIILRITVNNYCRLLSLNGSHRYTIYHILQLINLVWYLPFYMVKITYFYVLVYFCGLLKKAKPANLIVFAIFYWVTLKPFSYFNITQSIFKIRTCFPSYFASTLWWLLWITFIKNM